jgi:fused signal recognition particle receptor
MGITEKLGLSKLRASLAKTRENLMGKIVRLATTRSTIDENVLVQLEEILIGADVGVDASMSIVNAIQKRAKEERYSTSDELQNLLKDELLKQLGNGSAAPRSESFVPPDLKPHVIMVVGVNGVGKTTTIGKLAHGFRSVGCRVLIAAADTFRAAASEQLEVWARRAGAEIVQHSPGADPAAVAFDALNSANAKGADVLIVDTAGRLHTRVNLMEELKKIRRVLQKSDARIPQEILLVIDASTGQNGLQQAKQFAAAVGVTGLVLTKLDGTAKGGIVLAIAAELHIPVKYIGVGEAIEDLQPFDGKTFVDALFSQ